MKINIFGITISIKRKTSKPEFISKKEIDATVYPRKAMLPATSLQQRILDKFRLTDTFRRSYGEYLFSENPKRASILSAVEAIKKYKHIDSVDMEAHRDLIIDMLYSKNVLGFTYLEYFLFNFENTPIPERTEFLSETLRDRYYSKLNNSKEDNQVLDDKFRTYELLRPYYGRDVISISGDDFNVFEAFVKAHPHFVMKPAYNYGGHGVDWINCSGTANLKELYDSLITKHKRIICEEPVIAPEYMKKIYPHAINTVRVVTYFDAPGEPVIITALLRTGRDNMHVDNFSSGGIISLIDLDSGVIISDGVDRVNNRFDAHPDTGTVFKGFQIQDWNNLLEKIRLLAKRVPNVRLIGWDMAASADKGWQVIEANAHPWIEIHQFCNYTGMRRLIEKTTEWKKHGI